MRLVACKRCHAQYDTTGLPDGEFPCHCGAKVMNQDLRAIEARILRCGSCGAAVRDDAETCDYCTSPIKRDSRDLSLICPECYARNREDTRFCTACGLRFRPQPLHVEGKALACPACAKKMPPHQIAGMVVNECPGCRGLWVPRRNFDRLINRAIDSYRQRAAAGYQPHDARKSGANPLRQRVEYRRCPECARVMRRHNFRKSSGVVVDSCPSHGTWLDSDELEQIAGFILTGGRRVDGKQSSKPVTAAQDAYGRAPGDWARTDAAQPSDRPQMSQRTREILAERKARANSNRGLDAAKTVFGFLSELLTTEIS